MNTSSKILITGAAGFIASCLAARLNELGFENLILVDDFSKEAKKANHENKKCIVKIQRDKLFEYLKEKNNLPDFVFHLGARTDTAEFRKEIFDELNFGYSVKLWDYCTANDVPFLYASSAATYGDGSHGFNDDHLLIPKLKPLNPYGESKQRFDIWVLEKAKTPPWWSAVKFFNVYGPNEYHKGRMASVIFHSYFQVKKEGCIKLFKSHKNGFADGEQVRDFIYVKDAVEALLFLMNQRPLGGIFNLGTGKARTWNDLAKSVFSALDLKTDIRYIEIPGDIRDKYQYFTEAKMDKLIYAGYHKEFFSLESGVADYIQGYLSEGRVW